MAKQSRKTTPSKQETKPKKAGPPGPKLGAVEPPGPTGPGPAADPSLLLPVGSRPSHAQQDLLLALQRGFGNRAVNEMLAKPDVAAKQPQQLLSPAGVAERLAAGHAGAVVQFNKKLSPRIKAMVAHFEALGKAAKAPGMAPKAPGMAPKAPGMAPKAPGKAVKAPGKAPKKVVSAKIKSMIGRGEAQQDHTKDVNRLQNDVMAPVRGKAADPKKGFGDFNNLLINSVQWIDAGRTKLFALTKPHDWKARQKATGKADVPYFPNPPSTDTVYGLDPAKDNDFFDWNSAGTLGYRMEGIIAIIEPRNRPVAELQKTLVHEVQHDADFHTKMKQYHPGGIKTAKDYAERSLNRYMSEFRAYWLENDPGYGSARRKRSQRPYRSERHKKIAEHIIQDYDYAWECFYARKPRGAAKPKAWDSKVSGKIFKQWVYSYSGPAGYNLANSVRIAALIEKLQVGALKPGTSKWTAEAKDVKTAAKALDAVDKKCLRDSSSDVSRLIRTKLAGRVRRTIKRLIR